MNTLTAFAMGQSNRNNELMVFDWNKAAKLIVQQNAQNASAGLRGDWEWTGGEIYRDGKVVPEEDTYVYLSSTWAVPEIEIDGEIFDCFVMESETPEWHAHTYWPESALKIINNLLSE